jgi:hypothetical protein
LIRWTDAAISDLKILLMVTEFTQSLHRFKGYFKDFSIFLLKDFALWV